METHSHPLETVRKIWKLWNEGCTDDALHILVSTIPSDCYTEELLIDKASLIQISDYGEYELIDAENILKTACEFYPESAEAHYELGKFYDAVMADTENGLKYLKIAKQNLLKKLAEVEQGIRECTDFGPMRDFP